MLDTNFDIRLQLEHFEYDMNHTLKMGTAWSSILEI